MVQDSVRYSRWSFGEIGDPDERFAALMRAERSAILNRYATRLGVLRSPVIADHRAFGEAMTLASEIIADVAGGCARARMDDRHQILAWMTCAGRDASRLSPADLLRAAVAFFEVTVSSLADRVTDDPELMPCFARAVVALNERIGMHIREAALAYTGYLLERVDQAHVDERRRIARDLHDRLGEGLSVALRQLELHELAVPVGQAPVGQAPVGQAPVGQAPVGQAGRARRAKEAIAETMRRLRVVISDLRHDPVRSLENALIEHIDSAAVHADVRLRVSGDETWAPQAVIDEAFLILREAIRNALRHGHPRTVLIGVALAPYELHAWVEDDGRGFSPAPGCAGPGPGAGHADPEPGADRAGPEPGAGRAGTGLASMRERAALIGGRLTVASAPGQGTRVELLVPLPGPGDE